MTGKRTERAMAVCKKVVSAFSFSWKEKRDLAAAQGELKLPKHGLLTESPTRWESHNYSLCAGAGEGHCKGPIIR